MKRDLDVDESEYEWGQPGDSPPGDEQGIGGRMRRRLGSSVPRSTVALVAILVPMIMISTFLFAGGAAAVTATFTADNVEATSHNGLIQSLTTAPSGTITYSGFENQASTVDVSVQIKEKDDGSWTELSSKELSASGFSGELTYDFDTIDILQNSGWTRNDFRPADGENITKTLELRVVVTFYGVERGGTDKTETAGDSFEVTMHNEGISVGVGGKGNTNAAGNA